MRVVSISILCDLEVIYKGCGFDEKNFKYQIIYIILNMGFFDKKDGKKHGLMMLEERKEFVNGLHHDLDKEIGLIQEYIKNYNAKIELVKKLLASWNNAEFENLVQGIETQLKNIMSAEINEETQEDKYNLNALKIIRDMMSVEDITNYTNDRTRMARI